MEAMHSTDPDLSIIIPALNEAQTLPLLLENLSRQKDVNIEIILVDGGSGDGTIESAGAVGAEAGFAALKTLTTPPGRGRQMNHGAKAAKGRDLLFLHADARLESPRLLADAAECMNGLRAARGGDAICGHFPLSFFSGHSEKHRAEKLQAEGLRAFYFHEAKTCLNRPLCINGDQGFLLSARFFFDLGGFDESLPFLEDLRFAAKVFEAGEWVLLPGRLLTSSRRFETEGFLKRHFMNVLICAVEEVGLHEFFESAEEIYSTRNRPTQKRSTKNGAGWLELSKAMGTIHRLVFKEGIGRACLLWYKAGRFTAGNSWQAALMLDCCVNRLRSLPPGEGDAKLLSFFDRRLARAAESFPAAVAAGTLSFFGFYGIMTFSWLASHITRK